MDVLLILGGLLLILSGSVWLLARAFSVSLFWGLGSSLLPPVTLVFVLSKWRRASAPVTLAALGCIPFVVGFAMLAARDSERLEAILQSKWLNWFRAEVQVQPMSASAIRLYGELNGQPFIPDEGELVDGVLTLRERSGRLLSIRLIDTVTAPRRISVLPEDHGKLPLVEISWPVPPLNQPKVQHFSQGYTLYLDLEPRAPNLLVGDFHLVLPQQFRTSLSGRVELFANRLRYRDGKVDTRFDSEDTLVYVVKDHLAHRFASHSVQLLRVSPAQLPARQLEMELEVLLDGRNRQHLLLKLIKNEALGWRVEGDRFSRSSAVAGASKPVASPDRSDVAPNPPDRRQGFSLSRLQSNPADYRQLRMRVITVQGGVAEGVFTELDEGGSLVLLRYLGNGGRASYRVSPHSIQSLELLDP